MKSNNRKSLEAYGILVGMGRKQIPTPVAYKLYKLRQKLKGVLEFITEQEQVLAEKFGVVIDDDGHFVFPDDAEKKEQFIEARTELMDAESEIEGDEIVVRLADLPDKLEISMNEFEALEGFVRFE